MYFVAYQPSGQTAGAESTVTNTTNSEVVIGNLDPTIEYTYTVDVGTAGGKSTLDAGRKSSIEPLVYYPVLICLINTPLLSSNQVGCIEFALSL